ncbi:MAG: DUF4301 family protein [Crocinitomicaceae bacterium]|nr:DUF4301 family protein [Crocinitomicaceae bacterium]MDG1659485.1 DUF4301 family protein [Crocinitomicaceae bacterium]MDG2441410.1 DUF4301 family protein [Crocinitomicaceae bacterium]
MGEEEKSAISIQKKQVFDTVPEIELDKACSIESGIIVLSEEDRTRAISAFEKMEDVFSYFIPASGSGSRMFKCLHKFIETDEHSQESRQFFEELQKLALFQKMPKTTRGNLAKLDQVAVARYLLHQDGLNLSETPKGLIPFHQIGETVMNPFQSHCLQAVQMFPSGVKIHFTVAEKAEVDILLSIKGVSERSVSKLSLSFSVQDPNSHAYCFDDNEELVVTEAGKLRRPAGHGALLQNLNSVDADVILIKNIDNIQHPIRAALSNDVSKYLVGTLKVFQEELRKLKDDFSQSSLLEINRRFHWLSSEEVESMDLIKFSELIARPIRVCGMVKNEGEPGGGPFWVVDHDSISKQIVEKVQISSKPDQQSIMSASSHFNPVLIALAKSDLNGNRFNLEEFSNEDKYLNVKKTYKGNDIFFRELPGLWNGGMYNCNTLFVQIPSDVFSPVKSVLDLLKPLHKES